MIHYRHLFFCYIASFVYLTIPVFLQHFSLPIPLCPKRPLILHTFSIWQSLLTPGFISGEYPRNSDCKWVLKARQHRRIQLIIVKSSIEDRLFTKCDDYIAVHDGETPLSPQIAEWCGSSHPFSISSSADSLYIRFKTDSLFGLLGVNLTFIDYEIPGCPPDWSTGGEVCYKLWIPEQKVVWLEGQKYCQYDRSNLLTFSTENEYKTVFGLFHASGQFPWIGYTDAIREDHFASIYPQDQPWPEEFPNFGGNHPMKDCVYLNGNKKEGIGYAIDDCRSLRAFICKKKRDGTTAPYPAPTEAVQLGRRLESREVDLIILWPVLSILTVLLLLIIVLLFIKCCIAICLKRGGRVEPEMRSSRGILIEAGRESIEGDVPIQHSSVLPVRGLAEDQKKLSDESVNRPKIDDTQSRFDKETSNTPDQMAKPRRNQQNPNGLVALPLDRFDRPYIRMLDNVSAISMDEFWRKSGKKSIK